MNKDFNEFKCAAVTAIATEGVKGITEVGAHYAARYTIRRDSGFNVIPSAIGAFKDTKAFYNGVLTGKEVEEPKQAIYFDD